MEHHKRFEKICKSGRKRFGTMEKKKRKLRNFNGFYVKRHTQYTLSKAEQNNNTTPVHFSEILSIFG